MELLTKEEVLNLPSYNKGKLSGVFIYFLIDINEIVYIGLTQSLNNRMLSHKYSNKNFTDIKILFIEDLKWICNKHLILESDYIFLFTPKYNKNITLGNFLKIDNIANKEILDGLSIEIKSIDNRNPVIKISDLKSFGLCIDEEFSSYYKKTLISFDKLEERKLNLMNEITKVIDGINDNSISVTLVTKNVYMFGCFRVCTSNNWSFSFLLDWDFDISFSDIKNEKGSEIFRFSYDEVYPKLRELKGLVLSKVIKDVKLRYKPYSFMK